MITFSAAEAIQFGWKTTKEHFGHLVGLFVIAFIASIVLNSLFVIPLLGFLAALAGYTILGMGMTHIFLSLVRGEKLPYEALIKTREPFWRYLGATFLSGVVISAGTLLFIIPGIVLSMALLFVNYIVIDTNKDVVESLQESARITKGYKWKLFGLSIALGLMNFAGGLFFGIGLLITMPITMVALTYVYEKLSKQPEVMNESPKEERVEPEEPVPSEITT